MRKNIRINKIDKYRNISAQNSQHHSQDLSLQTGEAPLNQFVVNTNELYANIK